MIHNTTREHYNKYAELAVKLHVVFNNKSGNLFGKYSKEDILELYKKDQNLNNIPLYVFDMYTSSLKIYCKEAWKLSLSEGCCLAKHCLIYHTLGATPEFSD